MWISRKLARRAEEPFADTGTVTMNDQGGIEAEGSVNARSMTYYAPFGYTAGIPQGEEVFIAATPKGQAALGIRAQTGRMKSGEVMISSAGGATIELKNDGSIVLNGCIIIGRNGEVDYDIPID